MWYGIPYLNMEVVNNIAPTTVNIWKISWELMYLGYGDGYLIIYIQAPMVYNNPARIATIKSDRNAFTFLIER